MRATVGVLVLAAASAAIGRPVAAQQPITVRIHVVDSAGVPVAGAQVGALRGLDAAGTPVVTDARGLGALSVSPTGQTIDIVIRKIGFRREDRFFGDKDLPRILEITMARIPVALDTVRTRAEDDAFRKRYFVDADAIENSPRVLIDGLDVVRKLRPDMLLGAKVLLARVPTHATRTDPGAGGGQDNYANTPSADDCGSMKTTSTIYVNGERISAPVALVLHWLKPEHIAEMLYYPCWRPALNQPKSTNAIYVKLKPGIAFIPWTGSFVAAERPNSAVSVAQARRDSIAAGLLLPPIDARTGRVLGVFDATTGEPLSDVEILDVASGTRASTTATGSVSLAFLAEGDQEIRITKQGYVPQSLPLHVSPADTIPITVILARSGGPPER